MTRRLRGAAVDVVSYVVVVHYFLGWLLAFCAVDLALAGGADNAACWFLVVAGYCLVWARLAERFVEAAR